MWEAFKDFIFWCIQGCYNFIGDWGMAIVVVTIIFRLLIAPLMQGQIKSSFMMQRMQPRMQEIQAKYADNPQRQQEEMQKLYADAKFNPIMGCLPILLQMPIFMALFQVLRDEMAARTGAAGGVYQFYGLVSDLSQSPSSTFGLGFGAFLPYLILLIIFAGATFLPTMMMQRNQPPSPQKKQSMYMMIFMSVFMLWIGWGSPAGVLLFWGVSSLLGVAQTQFVTSRLKAKAAAEEAIAIEEKPVEVDVTRKVKKKRPTKSSK